MLVCQEVKGFFVDGLYIETWYVVETDGQTI